MDYRVNSMNVSTEEVVSDRRSEHISYQEEEEEEDIYLAQTMTTIAHNRTVILSVG